jgi:D-galacturonate reductase
MKVAVLGKGMYVTGRGGLGTGVILSSLAECSRQMPLEEVVILGRDAADEQEVALTAEKINRRLGTSLRVRYTVLPGVLPDAVTKICQRETFDAAIVSIPDHLHRAGAEGFLRQGVHCLVVKPLAPSREEAQAMIRLQLESGVLGRVDFHKRFDESNLYVKRLLKDGALGKIAYFTVEYSQQIRIPLEVFRGWASQTNIFQYLGVHYVDLIYFLTAAHPKRAMAVGTTGILATQGLVAYDSVHALIEWEVPAPAGGSFVSQFAVNWVDPNSTTAMSDQKYTVVGSNGRLDLDQKNRGVQLVDGILGARAVNPYFADFLPGYDGGEVYHGYGQTSVATFLRDVLNVHRGHSSPGDYEANRPSFQQALVSTAVIEAVNRSLRQGGGWTDVWRDQETMDLRPALRTSYLGAP